MGDLYDDYKNGAFFQAENDAIFGLLNHSDCDGHLTPKQMKIIVPRLKELISNWRVDDYDRIQGENLVKEMENSILTNKRLQFT